MEKKFPLQDSIPIVEDRMSELLNIKLKYSQVVIDAMRYSTLSGGKRFRPALFIEVLKSCDVDYEKYIDIACAIEFIHTYSLMHDDLPAMDDDDYRRGTLSCHKKYSEAVAILAGDALLNLSYELMFDLAKKYYNLKTIEACHYISKCAGIHGMIGGQVSDVTTEKSQIPIEHLQYIHQHKTGKLICASVVSAAILADMSGKQIAQFEKYAQNLGLAFQISDDVLDVIGDSKKLGKTTGKDKKEDKNTYPKYFGIEKSIEILHDCTKECKKALQNIGLKDTKGLGKIADYLFDRIN